MKTIYLMAITTGLAMGQHDVIVLDQPPMPADGRQRTFTRVMGGPSEAVKGLPYTAESVTEHTQVLADGNRITHSNKSIFARDSEGRTRRESTIEGLGPVGKTEAPVVSVHIEDPVAKVHYTLDSERKVAMKSKADTGLHFNIAAPASQAGNVVVERKIITTQNRSTISTQVEVKARPEGALKKEDLGTRNIEGVSAKGTKMVMTIPAGEVGNERPIEVVTETWYSDEIQAVVLTKHTDPRTGEMTNRLSNIRLGEPSKSLFEPPADYKVEEVSNMFMSVPDRVPAIRVKEDF